MFTLRFMTGGDYVVVAGARYDVSHRLAPDGTKAQGAFVTVYPKTTFDSGGVEFQVGIDHPNGYPTCFVENSSGKTIDRIGPFDLPPMPVELEKAA